MMLSSSFMDSLLCPCPCIIASKACILGTSNSDTIVQYRSAQKSVMTRILPCPAFSLSFAIARNFSTMGRTLPGLQYMTSRISSMMSPVVGRPRTVDLSVPHSHLHQKLSVVKIAGSRLRRCKGRVDRGGGVLRPGVLLLVVASSLAACKGGRKQDSAF